YAGTIVLRFYAMLIGSTLILATTKDRDIVYACRSMRFPYAFSFILTLAFRTLSLFLDDYFKVIEAMKGKGVGFENVGVTTKIRNYIRIATPLVVTALRRILGITNAIEAKGFRIRGKRSYYHKTSYGRFDKILLFSLCSTLIGLFIMLWSSPMLYFIGWPFIPWRFDFLINLLGLPYPLNTFIEWARALYFVLLGILSPFIPSNLYWIFHSP
ncbi:MAG: energy-coupling factor transporter transmembrane component T family protein, partial [Candidatus Ranarchaeia archaeon]